MKSESHVDKINSKMPYASPYATCIANGKKQEKVCKQADFPKKLSERLPQYKGRWQS
jgi:hypothetical protein